VDSGLDVLHGYPFSVLVGFSDFLQECLDVTEAILTEELSASFGTG
jgi:hypothetical protein